jgi:hypothetical protein
MRILCPACICLRQAEHATYHAPKLNWLIFVFASFCGRNE